AAIVRLTSGTTAGPRGVAVTVDQLLADARNITTTMGIGPEDSMVAAIPLGHAYGFVHVLMSCILQGTRPIVVEQPLPALLLEALSGPGPIVLPATPYLCELILQAAGRRRFRGLRLCLSAGAPLPERLSRAFLDACGRPVRTFYGASECGGICYDRSRDGILPDGGVGTPLEGVRVTVREEPGLQGAGRIAVLSAAVAAGYWPVPGGGDLGPGRFLTSDLGRIAPGGGIALVGRSDRMINVGGRKVNPAEVEAVLRGIPDVREAAVFAVPDRNRGQAVSACLVARRAVTREKVLEQCAMRLAPFQIPRHVEFVERIPRTGRGKTDRAALPALLRSAATSQSKTRPRPAARPARRPRPGAPATV
ncbi:MAG: class I adenylate-forming enzyme family protein, partial [Candidatus Polarisedimenticolia bacterium]